MLNTGFSRAQVRHVVWENPYRFLAQSDFLGLSCGLAFAEQVVTDLPVLDHDVPLSMLATDKGLRRFASNCIEKK